jgi:hypothetical protein
VTAVDGFTWTRHVETGGYFHCPNESLGDMREKGWEPSDPPVEPNPAVAEALAWRAEQAAAAKAEKSKPTKAAAGGKAEKE